MLADECLDFDFGLRTMSDSPSKEIWQGIRSNLANRITSFLPLVSGGVGGPGNGKPVRQSATVIMGLTIVKKREKADERGYSKKCEKNPYAYAHPWSVT